MNEIECKCSFCGKNQRDAKKLIASPNGDAYICDECIEVCKDKWCFFCRKECTVTAKHFAH